MYVSEKFGICETDNKLANVDQSEKSSTGSTPIAHLGFFLYYE